MAAHRRFCARAWTMRVELYNAKLAARIMTTGGAGGDAVFTEGGVGRSYLIGRGVPSEAISVETEGETTVESTTMAGEIMRRMGLHSAIVVSDGYHIFRVKRMLQSYGLTVYGSPRQGERDASAPRTVELRETGGRIFAVAGGRAGVGIAERRIVSPEDCAIRAMRC